jgi:hypothetical protein
VDDIRWLVARRAEALHCAPDEATIPPTEPSSTTDAVSVSAPVRTGSPRADRGLERSFRPTREPAALVLERSFDFSNVMKSSLDFSNLMKASLDFSNVMKTSLDFSNVMKTNLNFSNVLKPAFDTGKVLERNFDTSRVVRTFGTGKVLRRSFDSQRVAANLVVHGQGARAELRHQQHAAELRHEEAGGTGLRNREDSG